MIHGVLQFLSAAMVVGLSATLAFADPPADCYRIALKSNMFGTLTDAGCPIIDCDTVPSGTCEEYEYTVVQLNPATGLLEPAQAKYCLCTTAANKPCALYTYYFEDGVLAGVGCYTSALCVDPLECETTGYDPYSTTHTRARDCTCN